MKNDTISRQAAIDLVKFECGEWTGLAKTIGNRINKLPSAQSEQQSRIEKKLHGLTPEEQYAFLDNLMHKKAAGWNSSALYVIAWLKGEED